MGWVGWMDGWYPGGRGYRAPYGANTFRDVPPEYLLKLLLMKSVQKQRICVES